jgi:type II secretory pathway pseudopilin PulG
MLVVIAIILILASMTLVVIGVLYRRANMARALTEITALKTAVQMYMADHSAYPPDTGSWNETVFDPRSLHRYLGGEIKNPSTGKTREPYFTMRPKSLTNLDAGGIGVFVDPWGNPYQFDAIHAVLKDGRRVLGGWPYLPSRPKGKRLRESKILSFGPDGKSDPAYPFDWNTEHPDAKDDLRSW